MKKNNKVLRKLGICMLSFLMMSMSFFGNQFTEVKATSSDPIKVDQTAHSVTIGNEYISRQLSTTDNKLKTTSITNKRTAGANTVFTPAEGSEEFKINTTKNTKVESIDRTGWTATEDSYENATGASDGRASNMLDGDLSSIWHTKYSAAGTGRTAYPYNVIFTLNGEKSFKCFSYTPRQSAVDANGNIKEYELFAATSENPNEALPADSDKWISISKGDFVYDDVNPIYVDLGKEVKANQLKFVAITPKKSGTQFAGGAEFNLHSEVIVPSDDTAARMFKTSDLTLAEDGVKVEDTKAVINKVDKVGKKVTFTFEPYTFKEVEYSIKEVMVMYDGDHFMRKYLEISVPNDKQAEAEIDYIDLEAMNVNASDTQWTIPTNAGGSVGLDGYLGALGQPFYLQGMFFGSEFPETDTQIENGTGHIRYYSGKTFERLRADNQLTTNKDASTYVTWQTVAGAARSTEYDVIQSDFYEYIKSISTPSEFRIQYNSWFDNMMLIDDKNILESFIEIDKELNKTETRPLDSYVVDDGWNNYNNGYVRDPARSGTTINETGFWEFNTKFPQGLTPSSQLVQNFGSNFGVWVGPRGGYNYFGDLANILTKSGKGSRAGGSVDVADRTYLKNFEDMTVNWQKEYGVNYWKWDGYADMGQFNTWAATEGVPGRANNHMVGGSNHMYHVTDLWEGWIDLFESARKSEKEDNIKDLWISLTCYVNPSPWFLQWANSMWLQCGADRGETGSLGGKMDKMLTYREGVYYDFIKTKQFQFPLANIYNHDPIYGTEGTGMNANSMTDEEFSNYLYMMATRGTGFWELYYSDSIMTKGKYEINAEFLAWAEENFHILKNAKMIGKAPAEGLTIGGGNANGTYNAYGFSAWDGEDGIVSMRNPATTDREITFTLDRTIGAAESIGDKEIKRTTIHSYKVGQETDYETLHYGDSVTVTLKPGETRIWSLSTKADKTAPKMVRVDTDGNKTINVKFDEKVKGNSFTVEGAKVVEVKKSPDHISYELVLDKAPADNTKLKVNATDIVDLAGNALTETSVTTSFYKDNVVLNKIALTVNGSKSVSSAERALNSDNGFTVKASVTTSATDKVVAKQENGYTMGIDKDGYAYFALNGAKATSKIKVNDNVKHVIVGVKENNGMLKLYIDGTLTSSGYNQDNRYYKVEAGATTIGSAGFSGKIGIKVLDKGLGYDEVEKEETPPSTERQPLDTKGMKVAVSGTSDGSKDTIFDNNPTTFWTSQEKADGIQAGNPWLTIDLDGEKTIDRFDYTKRFYNSPANIWKCTGNLLEYVLEISDDKGMNWREVKRGATVIDASSTSQSVGGTTEITFEPVKATNIRISGTKSYHWQQANENKFMTVADAKLYSPKSATDKTALLSRIDELSNIDTSNATNDSVAAFENLLEEAQALADKADASEAEITAMLETLAVAGDLLITRGDTSALAQQVTAITNENLKEADYTPESWTEFKNVLDAAVALVADNSNATQIEVDTVASALAVAREGLVSVVVEDTTLMKSILKSAIDKAKAAEASAEFKTLAPSVQALIVTTRSEAEKVYNNADATNTQCLTAWMNLADALHFLDFQANKANLLDLINACKKINTDDYDEGVEEFKEALENAQTVYANDNALQASIDAAYERLDNARNGLAKNPTKVDKTLLESTISAIEKKVGNGDKYKKDDSWKAYEAAMTAAKAVIANEEATQVEVNAAFSELTSAYENIRLLPSEEQLAELNGFIAVVNGLNRMNFTKAQLMMIDETTEKVKSMIEDFDSKAFPNVQKAMAETLGMISDVNVDESIKPIDPVKNNSVNTGDSTNIVAVMFAIMLSGCGVVLLCKKRNKKA